MVKASHDAMPLLNGFQQKAVWNVRPEVFFHLFLDDFSRNMWFYFIQKMLDAFTEFKTLRQ